MQQSGRSSLEEAFIKVSFDDEEGACRASREGDSKAYSGWVSKGTSSTPLVGMISVLMLGEQMVCPRTLF